MKLNFEDKRHLEAAEGWLELGNPLEANEELELIAPETRAEPVVLRLRWGIYAHAKRWEMAAEVAQRMAMTFPEEVWGFIQWAKSLHELKRTKEAREVLLPLADKFPNNYLIQYNLSCYSCQLGELKEAFRRLGKAMDIAHGKIDIRQKALEDPDLERLWAEIAEI
jgi:predicted Zn-dependent protease